MLSKVLLIVSNNQYNSKRVLTRQLEQALNRAGVKTRVIDTRGESLGKEQITEIHDFNPEMTFSFNHILPMRDGVNIWDALEIPHLAILLDPLIYSIGLTKSPYCLLSYVDKNDGKLLESAQYQTGFFWPHAIPPEYLDAPEEEKVYDVVLLGSCYDHEAILEACRKNYSPKIVQAIEMSADITLSDPKTPFLEAMMNVWPKLGLSLKDEDFVGLCSFVDRYIRGIDRLKLVQGVRDREVHIFGENFWESGTYLKHWSDYLAGMENVVIHEAVPFEKIFPILQRSRLCLNSTPFFKNGSHERIPTALAGWCSVLTSENQFVHDAFENDSGVHTYRFKHWDAINDQVESILADEEKRREEVKKGREIVHLSHTWDTRVEFLQEIISGLLSEVYTRTMSLN